MLTFYLAMLDSEEDRHKFQKIYDNYSNLIYFVARKLTNDENMVEDIVQETYLKIIKNIETLRYENDKEFKDIDIATSATPEELVKIFPNANTRFSDMGCIELTEGDMVFQITTFRDEQLVTSRKTKDIHYSKKLTDDKIIKIAPELIKRIPQKFESFKIN